MITKADYAGGLDIFLASFLLFEVAVLGWNLYTGLDMLGLLVVYTIALSVWARLSLFWARRATVELRAREADLARRIAAYKEKQHAHHRS